MEINELLDKVEDAPENLREFYVKNKDGKFEFNPAAAVSGVKKNRDEILAEKRTLLEKYKEVDLDAYNTWRKEQEENKTKTQKDKGDWEAREASLTEAHRKELEKEQKRNEAIFKSLDKQLIENTTLAALNEAKVIAVKTKVLLPHVKSQLKVIEVDGEYVARVIDGSGKVRYHNGSEMTIAQLVAEIKADEAFSDCFQAETAKGSGTSAAAQNRSTGRAAQPDNDKTPTNLNPTERLKSLRRTASTAKR
jgi:hypothetical protein